MGDRFRIAFEFSHLFECVDFFSGQFEGNSHEPISKTYSYRAEDTLSVYHGSNESAKRSPGIDYFEPSGSVSYHV